MKWYLVFLFGLMVFMGCEEPSDGPIFTFIPEVPQVPQVYGVEYHGSAYIASQHAIVYFFGSYVPQDIQEDYGYFILAGDMSVLATSSIYHEKEERYISIRIKADQSPVRVLLFNEDLEEGQPVILTYVEESDSWTIDYSEQK